MALILKQILPCTMSFRIRGTSPLIQHCWSQKALKMMRMTAAERRKEPKIPHNPEREAAEATYLTENGDPGIPLLAFKSAIVAAAHKDFGIDKTLVRKAFFVPSTDKGGIIKIDFESQRIREDIARVGMSQTDLRYRPEFTGWGADIVVEVDAELLSLQNVLDLTNRAGFSCGICEWRPERGGEFGRFEVDTSVPAVQTDRVPMAAAA